jgi:hypothetical protein
MKIAAPPSRLRCLLSVERAEATVLRLERAAVGGELRLPFWTGPPGGGVGGNDDGTGVGG